MSLEDCFKKAIGFLSTLPFPLSDPVTPLHEHLKDDLGGSSENFAINFIGYLQTVGVLSLPLGSSRDYEINSTDLKGLHFGLYKAHLKKMVGSNAKHPLRRLLQES